MFVEIPSKRCPALQGDTDPTVKVYVQDAATVEVKPIRWLWKPWIPEGVLCLLDGDPGLNKSTLAIDLAARISNSSPMPLEQESATRSPGGVIICSAEDDFARTLKPRLMAAGANLNRVFNGAEVTARGKAELFRMPDHLPVLREVIRKEEVRFVVLDPLMAFLGEKVNPNDDRVRHSLLDLKAVAEEFQVTILGIRHFKKGDARALYKGAGNMAILGTARSAILVAEDPAEPGCRFLAMNKGNLGPRPQSLQFGVEEVAVSGAGDHIRIVWKKEVTSTAEDLILATAVAGPGFKKQTKICQAVDGLKLMLTAGPQRETVVKALLKQTHNIGDSTVEIAKAKLKVESKKHGGCWYWHLSDCDWDSWVRRQKEAANQAATSDQGRMEEQEVTK